MDLKPITLEQLFNADGSFFLMCSRHRGAGATRGPHSLVNAHDISENKRETILQRVNDISWRVDDAGNFYCPFCVSAIAKA